MQGLLSNAVYTSHYTRKQPVELSQWEKFHHLVKRLFDNHDIIPLAGTTAGLMLGTSIILLFLSVWYLCLWRRRRRRQPSSRSEYVNLLSMVSRATSDDSQYNQRRLARKNPTLWTLLLKKVQRTPPASLTPPKISGPACYLLYESENAGQLVQYYSAIPLDLQSPSSERTVVAIWKPSSHIPSHKFTDHAGRTVLTTNCTVGFQGKHKYCQGICKFFKSAFPCGGGTITLLQNPPIATDVYLYLNDTRPPYQNISWDVGKTQILPSNSLAVACVPANTRFHKNKLVDMYRWLEDGEREGSSIRF